VPPARAPATEAPALTPRQSDNVDEVIILTPGDAAARGIAEGPVYSTGDSGVRRPVGIRPRFWYDPPPGIPLAKLTEVEIVVSPRGEVETARIVGGPRTYFDGLILSAIKGWKFQPATHDGQPVAYRQHVWLLVE
jgi:TonB family protein